MIFKDAFLQPFLQTRFSPTRTLPLQKLHLGEISLECSRSGASAVALWATMRILPLVRGGEFATSLAKSRTAALKFFDLLNSDSRFMVGFEPELDISDLGAQG